MPSDDLESRRQEWREWQERQKKEGKWWVAAIVFPFLFFGLGVLMAWLWASLDGNRGGGMSGLKFLIPVIIGSAFGGILSIISTIVSLFRKEKYSIIALIFVVSIFIFILYMG